jgi:hypothetical protein
MPRLTGKNAALYLSFNDGSSWAWVADLYDWVVEIQLITFAASIKGDRFDRRVPSHLEGRLTARRYVQSTSVLAASILAANNQLDGSFAFSEGQRIQWAVVGVDPAFPTAGDASGFSGNANTKVQGTGYVDRAHLAAPRTQLEDDFEIQIDTLVGLV